MLVSQAHNDSPNTLIIVVMLANVYTIDTYFEKVES